MAMSWCVAPNPRATWSSICDDPLAEDAKLIPLTTELDEKTELIALVGMITVIGATGCAPRYNYYHHGPDQNLPTPSGSYTLQITAQTSNGITATTQSIPFALTVK